MASTCSSKLSFKDYSQDLYYVRDDFSIYSIKNNDYQIYSSVIANNNIDGLTKKDLNISIEILEKFERNEMNIKNNECLYYDIFGR